jgi:hypothetical protein
MEAVVFFGLLWLAYRMTHWSTEAEAVVAQSSLVPPAPTAVPRSARVAHANMRPQRKTSRAVDPCVDCTTGDCDGCPDNAED